MPRRALGLMLAALAAATLLLLPLRPRLDKVHVALVFLLVVLGGSALGGRRVGLAAAALGFLTFNYIFLPPYYTFTIADPLDWIVLVAFLVTSAVAAQLLHRAQREATVARARADEIERLSAEADRAVALAEADRLKDALLATVSHDLRTPLTTIRALAQDIAASGEERGLTIAEESDRLNRLVGDLLDLSSLKAGSTRSAIAINAAEDAMGAALQRVSGIARGRDLRASLDPGEPLLIGRFDLSQTVRVLSNLLENALKYSPADATVEFRVHREGSELCFEVLDRGRGIEPESRDRVFEPFVRGGTGAGREAVGGAGLGLAVARGLAEAQGGTLRYADREGGGSIFSLRVPAADLRDLGSGE